MEYKSSVDQYYLYINQTLGFSKQALEHHLLAPYLLRIEAARVVGVDRIADLVFSRHETSY